MRVRRIRGGTGRSPVAVVAEQNSCSRVVDIDVRLPSSGEVCGKAVIIALARPQDADVEAE